MTKRSFDSTLGLTLRAATEERGLKCRLRHPRSRPMVLASLLTLAMTTAVSAKLEFGRGGKPEVLPGGATPVSAFISSEDAEIREAPEEGREVIARARFLTPYYVAQGPDSKTDGFVLLAVPGKQTKDGDFKVKDFVGWARVQDCLLARTALKNEHGIFRKAIIVNDPQRLKATIDAEGLKAVPALNGPGRRVDGSSYDQLTTLGLYDFFYIYAEQKRADGTYLLIGDRPEIVSRRKPEEAVLGWVNDDRIFRWDTRQAIEFNKDNLKERIAEVPEGERGVRIFREQKELELWMKGVKTPPGSDEPLEPIAQEDTAVTFWRYNWPRYPILSRVEGKRRAGGLLQIGFIGDMIYVDTQKEGLKARGVTDAAQTIEQIKMKLRNIDLFFVVDSTGSMQRYFAAAAKAVREIADQVDAAYEPTDPSRPNIRYSVVLYRDYGDEDREDSYLTKRLPLTSDVDGVAKFFSEEPPPPNGAGGDEPEAVFHGVYTAVNSAADEMKELSSRAVVVMGDKGNHPEDVRGYDVVKLSKFLKERQADFYSVHVANDEQLRRDPDVRLFRDQMNLMRTQLSMPMNTTYYAEQKPEVVAKSIVQALDRVREDVDRIARMADELKRGTGFKELKKQYGLRLTDKFARMMTKAGLDPEVFVNSSVQVFGQGWAAESDPKSGLQQLKEVLLVSRVDFEVLVGYLAGFVRYRPTRENIRSLWTSVLNANLGEFETKRNVADLIQNHVGLPIRMKLLHQTLEEITNLSPAELSQLYEELSVDLRHMRGILSEQDIAIERDGDQVQVKRLGFHRYWWQAHGQEFAWIPLSVLP